jgi:hypothetical protein
MSNWLPGRYVPIKVPGAGLSVEDMARVTEADCERIQDLARRYCRKVDAGRSRKRMDGSATVIKGGAAVYGTDDVSDDTTQDAILLFAEKLHDMLAAWPVAYMLIATREPVAWLYERKRDGESLMVTRETLHFWAVRDAAMRNGCRMDVPPDEIDATPGEQLMRAVPRVEELAHAALSARAEIIWRAAFGNGAEFPVIDEIRNVAEKIDTPRRFKVISQAAQNLYGGVYASSRKYERTLNAAAREWGELSARLDDVRATFFASEPPSGAAE